MQTTLIRHAAPEAIRAIPIPGAPVHPEFPGVESWSRDRLLLAMNDATHDVNASRRSYRELPSNTAAIIRLRAFRDEWLKRIAHANVLEARRDVACHNDDIELREEIMEALVGEGKALAVAANLTSSTAKMLAEGKRLGII